MEVNGKELVKSALYCPVDWFKLYHEELGTSNRFFCKKCRTWYQIEKHETIPEEEKVSTTPKVVERALEKALKATPKTEDIAQKAMDSVNAAFSSLVAKGANYRCRKCSKQLGENETTVKDGKRVCNVCLMEVV